MKFVKKKSRKKARENKNNKKSNITYIWLTILAITRGQLSGDEYFLRREKQRNKITRSGAQTELPNDKSKFKKFVIRFKQKLFFVDIVPTQAVCDEIIFQN